MNDYRKNATVNDFWLYPEMYQEGIEMRKIIFLFFLCLCIQSCIRCYKEKEYLFEKSQYEEKINIIGIDDSFIIGTKLTFFIDKIIISKGLSLNK